MAFYVKFHKSFNIFDFIFAEEIDAILFNESNSILQQFSLENDRAAQIYANKLGISSFDNLEFDDDIFIKKEYADLWFYFLRNTLFFLQHSISDIPMQEHFSIDPYIPHVVFVNLAIGDFLEQVNINVLLYKFFKSDIIPKEYKDIVFEELKHVIDSNSTQSKYVLQKLNLYYYGLQLYNERKVPEITDNRFELSVGPNVEILEADIDTKSKIARGLYYFLKVKIFTYLDFTIKSKKKDPKTTLMSYYYSLNREGQPNNALFKDEDAEYIINILKSGLLEQINQHLKNVEVILTTPHLIKLIKLGYLNEVLDYLETSTKHCTAHNSLQILELMSLQFHQAGNFNALPVDLYEHLVNHPKYVKMVKAAMRLFVDGTIALGQDDFYLPNWDYVAIYNNSKAKQAIDEVLQKYNQLVPSFLINVDPNYQYLRILLNVDFVLEEFNFLNDFNLKQLKELFNYLMHIYELFPDVLLIRVKIAAGFFTLLKLSIESPASEAKIKCLYEIFKNIKPTIDKIDAPDLENFVNIIDLKEMYFNPDLKSYYKPMLKSYLSFVTSLYEKRFISPFYSINRIVNLYVLLMNSGFSEEEIIQYLRIPKKDIKEDFKISAVNFSLFINNLTENTLPLMVHFLIKGTYGYNKLCIETIYHTLYKHDINNSKLKMFLDYIIPRMEEKFVLLTLEEDMLYEISLPKLAIDRIKTQLSNHKSKAASLLAIFERFYLILKICKKYELGIKIDSEETTIIEFLRSLDTFLNFLHIRQDLKDGIKIVEGVKKELLSISGIKKAILTREVCTNG